MPEQHAQHPQRAQQLVSLDPSTGEAVGSLPSTPLDSIPRLVFEARNAQRGWGALSHAQRAEVLRPAAARTSASADAPARAGSACSASGLPRV